MVRRILVPLDGSARAEAALSWAIRLARLTGGELPMLAAVAPDAPEAERAARRYLAEIGARVACCGIAATTHVVSGRLPDAVVAAAGEADLIVLAPRGRGRLGRWRGGTVVEATIRGATTPLLLVPADAPPQTDEAWPTRLVVPLDGSSRAAAALPLAADLAARSGAVLTLAGSWPWAAALPSCHLRAAAASRLANAWERRLYDVCERPAASLLGRGLAVRLDLRLGEPAATALAAAAAIGADLLVVGTPARTGLGERRVGAVVEAILKRANAPVVLVPADRQDDASGAPPPVRSTPDAWRDASGRR
jgi:nucleotide-binding universal stress UspA family protein